MKLIFIFLAIFMVEAQAKTIAQTITFRQKNVSIENVFREIRKQTGYNVICSSAIINSAAPVGIHATNIDLHTFLDIALKSNKLLYTIKDKTIIVTAAANGGTAENIEKQTHENQQKVYSGQVRDTDGNSIKGAGILLQGKNTRTLTDADGKFQLQAVPGDVLLFSHVGYQSAKVTLTTSTTVNITLALAKAELDEVVVVGYGTQRKSDLTGSVSTIKSNVLASAPIGQVGNSLQGLATGVDIVSNGGSPAAEPIIQIRGTGSINASNPLVVIDGVPSGNLSDINPNDIAQIEVLKDASSAAIYGTRAANGVILVTTKRGSFNQPTKYNLNLYSGISKVNNKLDLLKADELVMLKKERYTNDGITGNPFWDNQYYQTTRQDWQDALFQTGRLYNADLSISSGGEKSSYLNSFGYYSEDGVISTSKFRRISARMNANHLLFDKLKINQSIQYSYREWNSPGTSTVYSGVLWQALRFNPAIPVMDENGKWGSATASNELGDINNPLFEIQNSDFNKNSHNLLASMSLQYEILPGLSIKGNVGFEGSISRNKNYFAAILEQTRRRNDAELNYADETRRSILGEGYLDFQRTIGKHRIDAVAGTSIQSFMGQYQVASKRGYADDSKDQIVLDNGAVVGTVSGNFNIPQKLASVFGRLNYSYDNKYLLTATLRSDGSSKFAKGNRWGYFPGFSVGWRMSKESFMQDISWVDDLKIKGGWGKLGNQEVADLQYLTLIRRSLDSGNKYTFGSDKVGGARISSLANPFITWEKTAMTNIGVDGSFFEGHLSAGITYFDKRTTDMLIPAVVMGSVGIATIPDANIGEMRNHGWEIEIKHQGKQKGDFNYFAGLNLTLLKNKVTKLYGNNNYIGSRFYGRQNQEISRTYEGMPLASYFGWKTNGLYQNQNDVNNDPNIANDVRKGDIKPGDVRFIDINGDGKIDEQDRTYLGDPNPTAILGIQLGASYKRFTLAANVTGSFGAKLYNADRMQGIDPTYSYNMYAEASNRWHGEGSSNTVPRMTTQRTNLNHRTSDLFVENGDFVKMKSLTLSYTLIPRNKTYLKDMTVYIMGENLFTITKYSGYNPEIGYSDGNLQRGVDYANFPFSRKINLGFKFNF